MYLDLERNRCTGDLSPPSDNVIFDNQCYATTPSSSNGNSDMEQPQAHCQARRCNGPAAYQHQHTHHHQQQQQQQHTSRLLLEYEMHLRNTLAKGMDAESYSLHTFEALLSQSMENLGESVHRITALYFTCTFTVRRKSSVLRFVPPRPDVCQSDTSPRRSRESRQSIEESIEASYLCTFQLNGQRLQVSVLSGEMRVLEKPKAQNLSRCLEFHEIHETPPSFHFGFKEYLRAFSVTHTRRFTLQTLQNFIHNYHTLH
jgi:hypothetical protein